MTPKEKAKIIIDKILDTDINFPYVDTEDGRCIGSGYMTYKSATKIALILVDEILSIDKVEIDDNTGYVVIPVNMDTAGTFEKYWNEVKVEIYNVQPGDEVQCGVGKNNI